MSKKNSTRCTLSSLNNNSGPKISSTNHTFLNQYRNQDSPMLNKSRKLSIHCHYRYKTKINRYGNNTVTERKKNEIVDKQQLSNMNSNDPISKRPRQNSPPLL